MPLSVSGPFGNEWNFIDPETFAYEYSEWNDEFYAILYDDPEGRDWEDGECWSDDNYVDDDGDGCEYYEGDPEGCG
jgi:hypothetical protein